MAWWLALGWLLGGCAYVTKDDVSALVDHDQDGWPVGEDCNDNNSDIFPFAPDEYGDACDADCGTGLDSDGDDWPDGSDCDPEDEHIYPCSPAEIPGDQVDSDCDGSDGVREETICFMVDPNFEESTRFQDGHCDCPAPAFLEGAAGCPPYTGD
jgi:hypothetical protein